MSKSVKAEKLLLKRNGVATDVLWVPRALHIPMDNPEAGGRD